MLCIHTTSGTARQRMLMAWPGALLVSICARSAPSAPSPQAGQVVGIFRVAVVVGIFRVAVVGGIFPVAEAAGISRVGEAVGICRVVEEVRVSLLTRPPTLTHAPPGL